MTFPSALINSTPCSRSGGYRLLLPCTLYILRCTGFSVRGGGSTFKQAFSVTYLSGSGDLGPVVNYFSIAGIMVHTSWLQGGILS